MIFFRKSVFQVLLKNLSDSASEITEAGLDALGKVLVKLVKLAMWPVKFGFNLMTGGGEVFSKFDSTAGTGGNLAMTLPLVMVLLIILIIYVTFVFCWMPVAHVASTGWQSVVFHLSTAMSLISYYRAVFTDPGTVPKGWEPSEGAEGRRQCQKCARSQGNTG